MGYNHEENLIKLSLKLIMWSENIQCWKFCLSLLHIHTYLNLLLCSSVNIKLIEMDNILLKYAYA